MTADSARDVQTGIRAALAGDAGVAALIGARIFEQAPQGAAFPHIVIEGMETQAFDTQGSSGNELQLTLRAFSRARGFGEVQNVLAAVRAALHEADFSVPGQILISCRQAGAELSGGGELREGVARFHIITEPA
jgi:hypothetical protein